MFLCFHVYITISGSKKSQEWHYSLSTSRSLRTYGMVKGNLQFEGYLDSLNTREEINMFTRLRGGFLRLRANTGRWGWEGVLPYERRICTFCNCNKIEDEYHVLFVCPVWSSYRDHLMRKFVEFKRRDLKRVLASSNRSMIKGVFWLLKRVLLMRQEIEDVLSSM